MATRDGRPRRARTRPPWAWRLVTGVVAGALRVLFGWRVRIVDTSHVPPPDRPLLLAFNHTSQVDAFVVARTIWTETGHWGQPLAKEELFRIPVVGWLGRLAGGVPVGRGSREERSRAYDAAIARLREGGCVMLAPEGTITHDGNLLPMRHGAARMALEAGCDVLVVTSFGAQRAFSPVARLPHRGAVVDLAVDVLVPRAEDDASSLTGRIAATMEDALASLAASHPVGGPDEPWWPPYAEPGTPTRIGRENLANYRASMAASVQQARERAEQLRTDARERAQQAREQATHLADDARARVQHTREQATHLADEARDRAQHVREQAEHLAAQVRDRDRR